MASNGWKPFCLIGHPIDTASTNLPLRQPSLAWPGTEETCPKCHGQRDVYYLHAGQPGSTLSAASVSPAPPVAAQAACAPRLAVRQIPPAGAVTNWQRT